MKSIDHICFIVPNYPTEKDPVYTFVKELVYAIRDLGIECSVIAPQSITNFIFKKRRRRALFWQDKSEKNLSIDIYQPLHAPFININIKQINIAGWLTHNAALRAFKKIKKNPDVLYSHFWHSGVIAGDIANKHKIPFFIASGESKIWVQKLYSEVKINKTVKNANGVIYVSSKNKLESTELNLVETSRVKVIPNAINNKIFYKIEKNEARKKLGFNRNDFIVAFTGSFNERKGILRLAKACENISDIKTIYIGSGDLKPESKNIGFIGSLPHDQIVTYLNAADIFVLPTLAEGCSNAIIEAMACGLPIVSSDLPFNDDILNEKNSIRIDSNNIEEIRTAIDFLKNNKNILEEMSKVSLEIAENLEIKNRARNIIDFIHENI